MLFQNVFYKAKTLWIIRLSKILVLTESFNLLIAITWRYTVYQKQRISEKWYPECGWIWKKLNTKY